MCEFIVEAVQNN